MSTQIKNVFRQTDLDKLEIGDPVYVLANREDFHCKLMVYYGKTSAVKHFLDEISDDLIIMRSCHRDYMCFREFEKKGIIILSSILPNIQKFVSDNYDYSVKRDLVSKTHPFKRYLPVR